MAMRGRCQQSPEMVWLIFILVGRFSSSANRLDKKKVETLSQYGSENLHIWRWITYASRPCATIKGAGFDLQLLIKLL